ncbi:MAG TPA: NADH-quinone oxidoreductase subunit C [Bacteroidales bacterium]|nr:NADH-quinone oxidoreductase subunit C [Bacteroidales bacterium]
MEKKQLAAIAASHAPGAVVTEGLQFVEISVEPDQLLKIAGALKYNRETLLDLLVSVTGMDWGQELGTIYHFRSTTFNHMIVLKTRVSDRENPEIDSLCSLYNAAEFHEREVYDLLGIKFRGHPDLRRLFLDSTWGFPLRKDYKDDINIVAK